MELRVIFIDDLRANAFLKNPSRGGGGPIGNQKRMYIDRSGMYVLQLVAVGAPPHTEVGHPRPWKTPASNPLWSGAIHMKIFIRRQTFGEYPHTSFSTCMMVDK